MRVIVYYQTAVAISLAVFLVTSYTAWEALGSSALEYATWYLVSGLFTAAFIYSYWRYAVDEWRYTPQSVVLVAFYPLAYTIMYMSIMAISMIGGSGINLAVWASALVSAAMIFYALKAGAPLTSGKPWRDVLIGAREAAPLALVIGIPLAWLVIAFYEAERMQKSAPAASVVVWLSTALGVITLLGAAETKALIMQLGVLELFLWPGLISWEELVSRFLLPVVGPLANYMFVVLHAPSRWVEALFFTPAILAVISMATRVVTTAFEKGGLIAAISAHTVYNAGVGWLYSIIESPAAGVLLLIILILVWVGVRYERGSRGW